MIIVRIFGGLGNQMFQHAVGAALAQHHQCDLHWDLSSYEPKDRQRSFELRRVFGLDLPQAKGALVRTVLGWRGHSALKALAERRHFTWLRSKSHIAEPHFHYWPELFQLTGSIYLDGYWQSEKYFQSITDTIRKTYSFTRLPTDRNALLAEQMSAEMSVSVHIRRGDYVTNPSTNQFHGCCHPHFYQEAALRLLERFGEAHFFVFSDDLLWARNNLMLPGPCTYVDNNSGVSNYMDMQLMSLCKHHIIANSSFSWWGAWLGQNPQKMVIAPRNWFRDVNTDTRDVFCPGWITL